MAPNMLNALTVDLEEWFCVTNFENALPRSAWASLESRVEDATLRLLDLFARHDARATFFVLGWVGERHPALLRRIAEGGHELASHGYHHRLVTALSPEEFRDDVERSVQVVGAATGAKCVGFRAPSFSLRRDMTWAWDALIELGFVYDSSVFPVVHDRYGEPSAPRFPFELRATHATLAELPLTTVSVLSRNLPVAGGGYLRLYPLAVTRWAIRRVNREGHAAVLYVHPWEVDPGHPKPSVSRLTLTRHRIGLASVLARLDALLGEFRFGTASECLRRAGLALGSDRDPGAPAAGVSPMTRS